jgi:hypothetical protein
VVVEKFFAGAWMTLLVTAVLIAFCWLIHRHYTGVSVKLAKLSQSLCDLPMTAPTSAVPAGLDASQPLAVLLVSGYNGLGVHSLLTIFRQFPGLYKQVAFVSVSVMDSGSFKGIAELDNLKLETREVLDRYIELAHNFGLAASGYTSTGTDPVEEIDALCRKIGHEYPKAVFYGGKLIFRRDTWYQRLLHNETATAIQRRLQWEGLATVVLPVRVRE